MFSNKIKSVYFNSIDDDGYVDSEELYNGLIASMASINKIGSIAVFADIIDVENSEVIVYAGTILTPHLIMWLIERVGVNCFEGTS